MYMQDGMELPRTSFAAFAWGLARPAVSSACRGIRQVSAKLCCLHGGKKVLLLTSLQQMCPIYAVKHASTASMDSLILERFQAQRLYTKAVSNQKPYDQKHKKRGQSLSLVAAAHGQNCSNNPVKSR